MTNNHYLIGCTLKGQWQLGQSWERCHLVGQHCSPHRKTRPDPGQSGFTADQVHTSTRWVRELGLEAGTERAHRCIVARFILEQWRYWWQTKPRCSFYLHKNIYSLHTFYASLTKQLQFRVDHTTEMICSCKMYLPVLHSLTTGWYRVQMKPRVMNPFANRLAVRLQCFKKLHLAITTSQVPDSPKYWFLARQRQFESIVDGEHVHIQT